MGKRKGEVGEVALGRTMQMLDLEWVALDGTGAVDAVEDNEDDEAAGILLEEAWLIGDSTGAASMLRLAALRTMGVLAGNDAAPDASGVACFLSVAADVDEE
eukprot:6205353-Pleurochrysis_carterae.AAC.1